MSSSFILYYMRLLIAPGIVLVESFIFVLLLLYYCYIPVGNGSNNHPLATTNAYVTTCISISNT